MTALFIYFGRRPPPCPAFSPPPSALLTEGEASNLPHSDGGPSRNGSVRRAHHGFRRMTGRTVTTLSLRAKGTMVESKQVPVPPPAWGIGDRPTTLQTYMVLPVYSPTSAEAVCVKTDSAARSAEGQVRASLVTTHARRKNQRRPGNGFVSYAVPKSTRDFRTARLALALIPPPLERRATSRPSPHPLTGGRPATRP